MKKIVGRLIPFWAKTLTYLSCREMRIENSQIQIKRCIDFAKFDIDTWYKFAHRKVSLCVTIWKNYERHCISKSRAKRRRRIYSKSKTCTFLQMLNIHWGRKKERTDKINDNLWIWLIARACPSLFFFLRDWESRDLIESRFTRGQRREGARVSVIGEANAPRSRGCHWNRKE